MRNIRYTPLPAVGPDDLSEVSGSLLEFVLDLPYFLTFDLIPPLTVLNEVFLRGLEDAGMSGGCRWEPFEISKQEYVELVASLKREGFRETSPPTWVKSEEDWNVWKYEYELGVPSKEHYRLHRKTSKWSSLAEQALQKGQKAEWEEYIVKCSEASRREQEFMQPYIDKYHKKKGIR